MSAPTQPSATTAWAPLKGLVALGGCKSHSACQAEFTGGETPVLNHIRAMQSEFVLI